MSDPLGQFDWTQDDPEQQLMNLAKALGVDVKAADLAFQAILTPEQLEAYVTLRTLLRDKAQVQGAQRAFKAADKRKRQMVHEVRQMKAQVGALQKRDAAQAAEIARLQARVTGQAQHLGALQQARAPRPVPVPQEATSAPPERPQWDYTPVQRRRPQRGEVVTDSPFGVEVVARHVEEYVRKNGPCKKPDVSAALPTCRPYLSDAYRHLHSSKRVEVDGWSLRMWPANG